MENKQFISFDEIENNIQLREEFTKEFITSDNVKLRYYDYDTKPKSNTQFDILVLLLDLRGHGSSEVQRGASPSPKETLKIYMNLLLLFKRMRVSLFS